MLFLFSLLDTERLSRECCDHKSREYALIPCSVTFRDTLCAPPDSASNVLSFNQKRNLALNSVRAQQTFVAKVTL